MEKNPQMRAPVYEALEKLKKRRVVPFDVPGHKRGRGNPELAELLGEKCMSLDVNSMKPLDNLCHPVFCDQGGGGAGGGSIPCGSCFFYGGRNDRCRTEHGSVSLPRRRQDHFAAQCAQERDQCACALRRDPGLCQSGGG